MFDLNLRYCPMLQVKNKKNDFLALKFQFALRLRHLMGMGKKSISQAKIELWVDKNLDLMF